MNRKRGRGEERRGEERKRGGLQRSDNSHGRPTLTVGHSNIGFLGGEDDIGVSEEERSTSPSSTTSSTQDSTGAAGLNGANGPPFPAPAGSAGATGQPGATGPGLGQQPPVAAFIRPAGRGILLRQPAGAAAIRPSGLVLLNQLQAAASIRQAAAAITPAIGSGQPHPQLYAAAIGPVIPVRNQDRAVGGAIPRVRQDQQVAASAVIRPSGRGIKNQALEVGAIPAVGHGRNINPPADEAAPPARPLLQPVRRDRHVQLHMSVLQELFNFVTKVLRSGATIRNFEMIGYYRTTYSIEGDEFVAVHDSRYNFVQENKCEAGTKFLNYLIDGGAVTMVGPIITAGPRFQEYVQFLDLDRVGGYHVHNARSSLEKQLGTKNIIKNEYGEPDRYRCNLKYPKYGPGQTEVEEFAPRKQEALNLAYVKLAHVLYAAKKIGPAHGAMQQRPAGPQGMQQRPAGPQGMQQRPAGPQGMQQRPAGPQGMQQRPAGPQGMQQRPAGPQGMQQRPAGPPNVQQQRQPGPGQQRPSMPYPAGMAQRPGH